MIDIFNKFFDSKKKNYDQLTENINDLEQKEILKLIFGNNSPEIKSNMFKDLEIFEDRDGYESLSIYSKLNYTSTIFGDHKLKLKLLNFETNSEKLVKIQTIVKKLNNDNQKFQYIKNQLLKLKEDQLDILWLWKKKSQESSNYLDQVFLKGLLLDKLNESELFLKFYNFYQIIVSPALNILSPIVCVIIPYLMVKYMTPREIDFKDYFKVLNFSFKGNHFMSDERALKIAQYFSMLLWFLYYLHNIYSNLKNSHGINKIINLIHNKLNKISNFIKLSFEINCSYFDIFDCLKIERKCHNLWSNVFNQKPALLTDKGKILITYKQLLKKKDDLIPILDFIGDVDTFISISQLFQKQQLLNHKFSFPKYIPSSNPVFNAKQLWHPFLDDNKVITNDIILGGHNKNNALITGPNAGGKSTFIKSIAISILLSQTIGITCSNDLTLSIFNNLETYLNIPDVKGKESLFEAEVNRSLEFINKLNKMNKYELSCIIMDEIFNSTNPEEGISGGYSISKKLSSFENNISIITTHYSYLTLLEEKTTSFTNYKIPIKRDINNEIIYPYKLERGISNQFIAIELLKKKGFDRDIVGEALEICKHIQNQNQKKSMSKKKRKIKKKLDNKN